MTSDHPASTEKPYHHGNLRSALINAARDILESDSTKLTLRNVAKKAGVSHTAPYNHFQSKDALLAAIAVQGFEELELATETARAQAGQEAGKQLVATGLAYIRFGARHPSVYRLMFGAGKSEALAESVQAAGLSAFRVLVHVMEAGMEAKVFERSDPNAAAFTPWALVHGVTQLAIDQKGPLAGATSAELEKYSRESLCALLEGIRRR